MKRIFVEKRTGFDTEAKRLLEDLQSSLGITALTGLRIVNRYDLYVPHQYYNDCKQIIFSEPTVDHCYDEEFPISNDETAFAVAYLPGQYDQRSDSALQCMRAIVHTDNQEDDLLVESAKVYVCKGNLSADEVDSIKRYSINPVDSMESPMEKPARLGRTADEPQDISVIEGFITQPDLSDLHSSLGLAMSQEDLYFCRDYFKDEGRNPTETELRLLDTYWSDHCRHTTFLTELTRVGFQEGHYTPVMKDAFEIYLKERKQEKPVSLMDMALTGMRALKRMGYLNDLDESEEINACSIRVEADIDGRKEPWLVMFKNETHNHPTEIEPFGGAATCLGGVIRDPLSGRAYVYQAMRITGSGDPRTEISKTIPGKLPQIKITREAAHGYSSYGNQIGLATGLVKEIYHEGYVAKRMECGAVVAAAPAENVVRSQPQAGDLIILLGGRTGRDGCGGATGSSKGHTVESINTCGAEVQKGNPPEERKIQRLFRNKTFTEKIIRCNDFGAGGVSVAIGELADGLKINLDMVPKKYEGLNGTELAISESQERMALVVKPQDVDLIMSLAAQENLESTVVAEVTQEERLVMLWRGKEIVNISREFLNSNGASQEAEAFVTSPGVKPNNPCGDWLENLKNLNVCSQRGLVERFDSTIGAGTVLMPFGGRYQLTPTEVMAAKLPVLKGETSTATLMSYGYDPYLTSWSPFHGAVYAVVDSVTKIVAAGGEYSSVRLTFQEYFERLGKETEKWGKVTAALLGGLYAQMKLCVPSIGGKDSMSGSFGQLNVPPTLVSFAVNVTRAGNIISPEFKQPGNNIVHLRVNYDCYDLPDFEELTKNYRLVSKLISEKKILSAHTVGHGGVAAAISLMAMGNKVGADLIELSDAFSPRYGDIVFETTLDENQLKESLSGASYTLLGKTTASESVTTGGKTYVLDDIITAWSKPLEKIFPTKVKEESEKNSEASKNFEALMKTNASSGYKISKPAIKIARPRVLLPVFPGTNCEYDMSRAFQKAGAEAEVFVIKNLSQAHLSESIKEMRARLQNSQILALSGGFSAGDEPEGSGKYIAAFFRNPELSEAVAQMLHKGGLIIGICNGFQALIKLGLLPYGEIRGLSESDPTLTYNSIGRHVSRLVRTQVVSNNSPWLWKTQAGDQHVVAVSHGEGRFAASPQAVEALAAKGQIATVYTAAGDEKDFNPNGSVYNIEGITSPDGRILGKMGHSERIGQNLYTNVPGNFDQGLFESGVSFFL